MKTVIRGILAAALCAAGGLTAFAKGETYKAADTLSAGKSKTVTLVNEKDVDSGDYYDSGCYYIKVTCTKGKAYTVYVTNPSSEDVSISIDDIGMYDWNKDVDLPSFSVMDNALYYSLATDDWWDDSDRSGVYYVCLNGEIGDTATVTFASGIVEPPIEYGTDENPKAISVGASTSTTTAKTIDGSYYFTVNLTAGSRYTFKTSGGTEEASLTMSVKAEGEDVEEPKLKELEVGDYDAGYLVIPQTTGTHLVCVDGYGSQTFTLSYGKTPTRLPSAHAFVDLGAPTADGVASEDFELGHRNDPVSGYYDGVIDQTLAKVTLAAGATYRFETDGATVPAAMELYDAKGNVLAVNRGLLDGSQDCALSYKCATKGDYYVGVCEVLGDDDEDESSGCFVTLTARIVTLADGYADADDPTDDEATGATGLSPAVGTAESDVLKEGSDSAEHTLGAADLVDWFRIDARKGLGYKVAAAVAEPPAADFTLQATVYTRSGTKMTEFLKIDDLTEGGSFTATADASYYVEVTLKDAQGLDFGPYVVKSLAYSTTGTELGVLRVDVGGATFAEGATWSLGRETVKYPGGSSVMLPAGTYTVNFATVRNWTAPKAQTVDVKAGAEATVVDVKYSDTSDPKDDTMKGATKITPAAKAATVSRSLWSDDPADWFSFAVKANSYYSFALESSSKLGDATISVYASDGETLVAEGAELDFLCRETRGNWYVRVSHADEAAPADSQYTMSYSAQQVGAVGFAKTAVSVKDSATSVALTVNRANGREGRVRVRYATFAGTAQPGVNYFPQSGVLEWEANDTKAKTVTIGLIGDLVAAWKEDIAFSVRLDAVEPGAVEADERVPVLGATEATVTISSASKKTTGTVQFAGFGAANEPFANEKKPTATVRAGEDATFWVERVGGSDGTVAVTVTPKKGKALPDVNYVEETTTLVWGHGETEAKRVTVQTLPEEGTAHQAAKSLTLVIAADRDASTDTFKVGTAATLNVTDAETSQTVEEYAATFTKADGVTVKAAKADTWYFDAAGTLRSVTPAAGAKAELTVTLTGPGRLAFTPNFANDGSEKNTATCTIGKETIDLSGFDGSDGQEIVRYLGKGNTTVKFSVSRDRSDAAADADVYLALNGYDCDPFYWKQLAAPQLVAPRAGEMCDASSPDSHIVWTAVEGAVDYGDVRYRVWFVPEKQKATIGKGEPTEDMYTDTSFCPNCSATAPGPGESWLCRVDSMFVDEDENVCLVNTNTVTWAYKTFAEGAPVPTIASGYDVDGEAIADADTEEGAYPVALMQGVPASIALGAESEEAVTYALATGSKLPTGLKLDARTGVVSGVPTVAGSFVTVIQAKAGRVAGGTVTFLFEVAPCGLSSGTFNGLVSSDDERLLYDGEDNWSGFAAAQIGSVTVTATDAGRLSAKVTVGGSTYSFAGTSWGGKTLLDNGLAGVTSTLTSVSKFTVNRQSVVCTNVLTIAACAEGSDEWEALDTPMEVSLTMSFLSADKKSVLTNVVYEGVAERDNSKLAQVVEAAADFAGYYTVSLAPTDYEDYVRGYGYLTLTLDAKGKARLAGVLADGATRISASATVAYCSENENGEREASIPVYYGKGTSAFGGWLLIRLDENGVPVVSSDSDMLWVNAATTATYAGDEGFTIGIEPVGGYYDTVLNLQTHYLDYEFNVAMDGFDLPDELLGSNEAYVCYPGLFGDTLNLLGQTITADKAVKTMRTDDRKLVDWSESVNPSGLTMSFNRATGVYSGRFDVYAGDASDGEETKQVKLGSYSHQGVLLLSRDETSGELAFDDCVMPGFWTAALTIKDEETNKTRKFTASLPFKIVPEAIDHDWSEGFVDTAAEDDGDDDDEL